jgi:hypothetical protein
VLKSVLDLVAPWQDTVLAHGQKQIEEGKVTDHDELFARLELRAYPKRHQSAAFVNKVIEHIRDEVGSLRDWPSRGVHVRELEELQLDQYRKRRAGQQRIIVERAGHAFDIHIACHTGRGLESLLRRRLLAA